MILRGSIPNLTNYITVEELEMLVKGREKLYKMKNVWKIFEGWRRYAEDQYTVGSDPFYGPPPMINDVVIAGHKKVLGFLTPYITPMVWLTAPLSQLTN